MGHFANTDLPAEHRKELKEVLEDPSFEQGMRWLDRAIDAAARRETDPGQLKREARVRIGLATLGYAMHKIGRRLEDAGDPIR